MAKRQALEVGGRRIALRVDQLDLIAGGLQQFRTCLGANADPIDADGSRNCSVGFDRNFEAVPVQGIDQLRVKLK